MGVIASDSFNRADGPIGSADTGQTWVATNVGSTFAIISNQAGVTSTFAAYTPCVVQTNVSDCTVSVDVTNTEANTGLCFRCIDDSNYWMVLTFGGYLFKNIAGAFTLVATGTGGTGTWQAVLSGSSIVVKNNGVVNVTATDSTNATGTQHGLVAYSSSTQRWDNFSVTTPDVFTKRLVISQAVKRAAFF